MNNTACEDKQNEGPIPRGKYLIFARDLDNPEWWDDIARAATGDWGDWRVPLIPHNWRLNIGNCNGRKGFYLHGGFWKESAGCIDIGGGIFGNELTDKVFKDIENDPDGIVRLYVR